MARMTVWKVLSEKEQCKEATDELGSAIKGRALSMKVKRDMRN